VSEKVTFIYIFIGYKQEKPINSQLQLSIINYFCIFVQLCAYAHKNSKKLMANG